MKIQTKTLQPFIDDGYISVQKHPTEELFIYNYTRICQYEPKWTPETLMCRGLILDGEGNIVARPFPKFFNLGELENNPKLGKIPDGHFNAYDKVDGSLGICYVVDEIPYIATRGSFTSDQAVKANEILKRKNWDKFLRTKQDRTFLFEIIYPSNRIVVDYDDLEDLILLDVIDKETGESRRSGMRTPINMDSVVSYDFKSISAIEQEQFDNNEGYVIHWPKANFRAKFKVEEYVRLHRIVTNTNEKRVWESLKNGDSLETLLNNVPDEFHKWVSGVIKNLSEEYENIRKETMRLFVEINGATEGLERKQFALAVKETSYPGILFRMLDGGDPSDLIWKLIEPEAKKPFYEEGDNF